MRKKTLLLVIFLMTISLIGLIGFQVYWIHHAVEMEEEVFDRNVNDALHQVARRLETKEAVHFLKEEAPQIRAAALSPETPALPGPTPLKKEEPAPILVKGKPHPSSKVVEAPAAPKVRAPQRMILMPLPVTASPSHSVSIAGETLVVTEGKAIAYSSGSEVKARTHVRGARAASRAAKPVEIFGGGITDSVVVWKVLASQKPQHDSLFGNKAIAIHRAKADSGVVFRMSHDSVTRARQHKLLRQIEAKNIREVRVHGKAVDILVDSMPSKTWRQAITLAVDSIGNTITQYLPAERGTLKPVTTVYSGKKFATTLAPSVVPTEKKVTEARFSKKPAQEKNPHQKAEAKAQHLNQVMQQMAVEYVRKEIPLAERLNQLNLDELLASELEARNISAPYRCSVKTTNGLENPSLLLASSNNALLPTNLGECEYVVRLFPNDVMTAPGFLLLSLPNRSLYVWQSLLIPSVISVLFTLIIILTFSFTLYTILRQKKISEIKNDFINNMTHEFKTPIATISLALDALVNPKVRKDEARIDYYAHIIRDENKRMHQQVEKVLQTAQMERKIQQLAFEKVDVHQLISKVAEPFQLHIEQRDGVLDLKLDAQEPHIWADPSHLANMIGNLLDNANKYSPGAPKIVIQTSTISKGLHISVEDQGVGMSREAQKKVFDKFYRVPTGNVHNVKGFGLGLSYVKTMAEAHSGNIHLRSELGKGSKFTLWLPSQKHVS
ncbi:sensor histidine kinase [Rufibacter tibetensis]|uniref:sensor histidine kinase n=1 Tax=Rufibacter tibetensis TaxID=512763 RepID=UPI000786119B|nr:HAMP domain-containing sensor histidine kinase [Rufibacter tibetensis]